jgi:hypothetical protein
MSAFILESYSAVLDAAEVVPESEVIDYTFAGLAVPVRFWRLPGAPMKIGVLEKFWQALDQYKDDAATLLIAIRPLQAAWMERLEILRPLFPENLSIGNDGIALLLDE